MTQREIGTEQHRRGAGAEVKPAVAERQTGRTLKRRVVLELAALAAAAGALWLYALRIPQRPPDLQAEIRAERAALQRRLQMVKLEQAALQLRIEVSQQNFAAAAPLADGLFHQLERAAREAGPFSPLRRALRLRGRVMARLEARDAGVLDDVERLGELVRQAARSE